MGGIDKTTIAQYIFNKCFSQYEGSCFLKNVREKSGECGRVPENLRDQLYLALMQEKFCPLNEVRLSRQSNLIVLDDVSSSQQVEDLVGELRSFSSESPDSRIIITTRDKSVLKGAGVEHIYIMKELDDEESLKLFCLKAFIKECPKIGYEEMSRRAIVYCKGIPLALKVLGSFVKSNSEKDWDSALRKLERIPNEEIQNVLRPSYVGLSNEEQQIFLDIACFFKGEKEEYVIDVLDSCGFFPHIDMRSLLDKSLINISSGFVWMHDLIQEMGREIVRQKSIKNPGERSRLWDFDDIRDVLENNKGTDAIEGIKLDMSQTRQNLRLSSDAFKNMSSLKYLSNMCGGLELPNGLESLPNELRYIKWHGYPLQSLPSNFRAEKLVTLIMFDGQFERLWNGVTNLVNLKKVKLTGCRKLMELPDFSQAPKLKIVDLYDCRSLRQVHIVILSHGMLKKLRLDNCRGLQTLKIEIHSTSLNYLSVSGCIELRKFSLSAEVVEDWNLTTSGIEVLDSSIEHVKRVKTIDLSGLRLENLPEELSRLGSLETLKLSGCGQEVSKQNLHHIFWRVYGLVELYLDKCHGLFELPDRIAYLQSLQVLVLDKSNVKKLPESMKDLSNLKTLSLRGCGILQSLPELPSSICHLDALNCTCLQTLPPKLFCYPPQEERKYVSFQNCMKLDLEKFISSFHSYVSDLVWIGGAEETQPRLEDRLVIVYTDDKIPKSFTYKSKGASITFELPPSSDHYLGLLLCVVLSSATFPLLANTIKIRCECYLEDGGKQQSIEDIVLECRIENTMEDGEVNRVCISYDFGRILEKTNACRANNQYASTSYDPKVTFKFSLYDNNFCQNFGLVIKECGVYIVNASNCQTNEVGAGHGTTRQRHEDIPESEYTERE